MFEGQGFKMLEKATSQEINAQEKLKNVGNEWAFVAGLGLVF